MAGRVAYYGNIVKDGLVLCLDAGKVDSYPRSGTTWNDISGFNNSGTLTNGPTFDSSNYGSIVFDGSNDNINCGPASFLGTSLTGLTVNAWVYSTDRRTAIIAENGSTYILNTFYLAQEDTSNFSFLVASSSVNAYDGIKANYVYSLNTWYNLTGVWSSGSSVSLYSNAVLSNGNKLVSSVNVNQLKQGNTNLFLGARPPTNTIPFQGRIPYFSIYNRALSATEITQNYNALRGRFGL